MDTRDDEGPRRVRGRARTRERLLAASLEIMVESGYQAATVSAVARRAGLTTGAIYANFANQQEMLGTALLERWSRHHRMLLQAGAGDVAPDEILVEHFVAHLTAEPRPEHELLTEATGAVMREDVTLSPLRRGVEMLEAALLLAVERGQAAGTIDPDLSVGAVASVLVTFHLGAITSKSYGLPQLAETDARSLLEALTRALAP